MPKRLALSALILLLPLQAWAGPNPDAIYQLSADEERRVQKGEVIVHVEQTDEPIKRTLVVGLIGAPPEMVFPIYTDFASYTELFESTRTSEVLRHEGNLVFCKFIIDFPWPLGSRWISNQTTMIPDSQAFTFKKHEGTVKVYEGALKVLPEPHNRSRVVYTAKIDPDLPLPAWLVNMVQAHYFPNVIHRVRERLVKLGHRKNTDI